MIVIEMNPRVSRSSALASKATGFPIAKVAAKLAVGYTLDELANDITGGKTPASFEPSIDYVVTKVPRFAFEKFPEADSRLTTQMKSVGEVMAIGRTFQESLQKALRGLEIGVDGFDERSVDREEIEMALSEARPERIWYVADAFRIGMSLERNSSADGDRSVVPGADRGSLQEGRAHPRQAARFAVTRRIVVSETCRLLRQTPGDPDADDPDGGSRASP
jgi:hypothetical protein